MIRFRTMTTMALALLACGPGALVPQIALAKPTEMEQIPKMPEEIVYKRNELPFGGRFMAQPLDKKMVYYFIESYKLDASAKKPSGLYRSEDGGQTWNYLRTGLRFKDVFIHPISGEFFGIVDYQPLMEDRDGFLYETSRSKVIRSVDGQKWKDLMGKMERAWALSSISFDPEYPQRIRVLGWGFRGYWLKPVDDDYSDWKFEEIPSGPPF